MAAAAEQLELDALRDWHAVAQAAGCSPDWRLEPVGHLLCSVCDSEPNILINRVFGLRHDTDDGQLADALALYRDAGVDRFFLHVIPEQLGDDFRAKLTDAGYQRYRAWMKFQRSGQPIDVPSTDFDLQIINSRNAEDFARIVSNAFDFEPTFRPTLAALTDSKIWQLHMSFDGDQPAGTGGLFIANGGAYFDFGATDPTFRQRGSQTTVLKQRVSSAADHGVDFMTTMTGEAVPGDKQHSYSNILKCGFEEAYLRENWIPAGS
ncbi:MAG: hypothetical protein AAF351_05720 [Pseudomonadota bacterium]